MGGFYYPRAVLLLKVRWEDAQYKAKTGNASKPDEKVLVEDVITVFPKTVRIQINSYQEADTFSAEIDYKSFPFDPRTIRACQVTVLMKDSQAEYRPTDDTDAMFTGFADEESITFDEGRRVVKLEGRDLTSLFIDKKYGKGTVDLTKTIKQHFESFVKEIPGAAKIKVEARPDDLPLPKLSEFWPGGSAALMNVKNDDTYWGVVQEVASRAALIAYIENDKLIITKPRTLYDESKQKAVRFIYGKNVKSLEYKKKIGRRKGFNIIVRSMNERDKVVIEAKIPAQATEAWSNATGIPNIEIRTPDLDKEGKQIPYADLKPAPYIAFLIPKIVYQAQLVEIGEQTYEAMAREQIEGSLETFDMDALQVNGSIFDLLKLRMGAAVQVQVDQPDLKALTAITSSEEQQRFLLRRGYSANVAKALSENLRKLSDFMYVKGVEFNLSATSLSIKIDFINFIETSLKV